jgi:hypothetical protein
LDFYLFEKVNSALIGQEIPDGIGLLEIVAQMLDGILNEGLQAVFRSWIEYVQNIIHANGDYTSFTSSLITYWIPYNHLTFSGSATLSAFSAFFTLMQFEIPAVLNFANIFRVGIAFREIDAVCLHNILRHRNLFPFPQHFQS